MVMKVDICTSNKEGTESVVDDGGGGGIWCSRCLQSIFIGERVFSVSFRMSLEPITLFPIGSWPQLSQNHVSHTFLQYQLKRTEYKSWNRKVKELVKESKRRVDDEFGGKLSEKFNENKLFWKEVTGERKRCGERECESEERGWNSCK